MGRIKTRKPCFWRVQEKGRWKMKKVLSWSILHLTQVYRSWQELAGAPKTAEHPRMLLPSSDGPKPGGAAAAPGMWGSPAQCQPLGCPQTRGAGTQGDPAGKNKTPECILSSFPAKGKQAQRKMPAFGAGVVQRGLLVLDPLHLPSVGCRCGPMSHILEHP